MENVYIDIPYLVVQTIAGYEIRVLGAYRLVTTCKSLQDAIGYIKSLQRDMDFDLNL
jgi:hypothetical protein